MPLAAPTSGLGGRGAVPSDDLEEPQNALFHTFGALRPHGHGALRLAPAEAGFVRVTAGHAIPRHRHIGPEVALVLEGTMCEDGVRHFPGETVSCGAGSVHGFKAGSERDLVFVVTHSGIEIL